MEDVACGLDKGSLFISGELSGIPDGLGCISAAAKKFCGGGVLPLSGDNKFAGSAICGGNCLTGVVPWFKFNHPSHNALNCLSHSSAESLDLSLDEEALLDTLFPVDSLVGGLPLLGVGLGVSSLSAVIESLSNDLELSWQDLKLYHEEDILHINQHLLRF